MTEERRAWLFDFGGGLRAVIGGLHLSEYLLAPQVFKVPLTPVAVCGVLVWRKRLVPLLDFTQLVANNSGEPADKPKNAIVLVYRTTPKAPLLYGALALATTPREIGVRDDLACELPAQPAFWKVLAASCIHYESYPTPILRVGNIFTQALKVSGTLA